MAANGGTVFVGAATVGSISGGGFNPAVALGLSVGGYVAWSSLWLYIVAPVVGAVIAAVLFRVLNADDTIPRRARHEEPQRWLRREAAEDKARTTNCATHGPRT